MTQDRNDAFQGSVSTDYRILEPTESMDDRRGWISRDLADRQQAAFAPIIEELRRGRPRADFRALADAVLATEIVDPTVVEIGCAGAWNAEVLERLVGVRRYVGIDIAPIKTDRRLVVGDAVRLPLRTAVADIGISGTSLMHIADSLAAVKECARISSRWCIFHTVIVLEHRASVRMRKLAYGEEVFEIIFNEGELLTLFRMCELRLVHKFPSIEYNLESELGEKTFSWSYLCERI